MSFVGKWMDLQIIMLSKVSQAQKDKGYMFSLICGRKATKINEYKNTNMISYIHTHNLSVYIYIYIYISQ
jgi:hypothetical protein